MTPFEIDWSKSVAYTHVTECPEEFREDAQRAVDRELEKKRLRDRERMSRLRRYNFSARDVMDLFTAIAKGSGDVLVPENFAFPKGAIVTNVSTPTFGRYISVTVQHDSFDVVDDACEIPLADPEPAMMRRFTIKEV